MDYDPVARQAQLEYERQQAHIAADAAIANAGRGQIGPGHAMLTQLYGAGAASGPLPVAGASQLAPAQQQQPPAGVPQPTGASPKLMDPNMLFEWLVHQFGVVNGKLDALHRRMDALEAGHRPPHSLPAPAPAMQQPFVAPPGQPHAPPPQPPYAYVQQGVAVRAPPPGPVGIAVPTREHNSMCPMCFLYFQAAQVMTHIASYHPEQPLMAAQYARAPAPAPAEPPAAAAVSPSAVRPAAAGSYARLPN